MFSTIYFTTSSVLSSLPSIPAQLAGKILAGQFQEAVCAAANLADNETADEKPAYGVMQVYGDIQLVLGRHEEAEETYRKGQKLIRHSRDAMRIASCRNAGWQAFFRSQFNVALTCFKRVVEDSCVKPAQRLDALLGTTLILFHLGCIQAACDRLGELAMQAESIDDPRWSCLVEALRRDLLAQHDLHGSELLADHIYWRSVLIDFLPRNLGAMTIATRTALQALPVIAERLAHLERLQALAAGQAAEAPGLSRQYVRWSRKAGLTDYHRSLCLEIALAALAARLTPFAETMLDESGVTTGLGNKHARWYLDYLYCRAKIMQQQMRVQDFAQQYARYALASIQHVRADNVTMPAVASEMALPSRTQHRSDDVSARLPAKYRRAYRYLMDNLDQKDLSVREVASQIGVTERAIQAAFKNHLGLSPSELIRRQRMERIRGDLMHEDAPVTRVLDIARKWGVQHRSTLINGYRRVFHEAPSETLGR
jgi:AraC-like DNA-binding protein